MKLFGSYAVEKLVSALQGQFSFTWHADTNSAILDVFSLRINIQAGDNPVIDIYLIQFIGGVNTFKHLITLEGDARDDQPPWS